MSAVWTMHSQPVAHREHIGEAGVCTIAAACTCRLTAAERCSRATNGGGSG